MTAPTAGQVRSVQPSGAAIAPQAYFVVSAVFHNLGPAFAVLLFQHIDVLGVAWLRIASAALIFAIWRQPWRVLRTASPRQLTLLVALGVVLGLMNSTFYLAIERLHLGTVSAIEFVGPIILAAIGARSARNMTALVIAVLGIGLLADVQFAGEPLGFVFALANCALFMLYVMLGHRIARDGGASGIDRLGVCMLVAFVAVSPIGLRDALPAFSDLQLLLAAIGVGICSSVIPYVCDQLAMARLSRSTFALLLSLLPATATVIGIVVLQQIPSPLEIAGIVLVISAVAMHRSVDA